MDLQTTVSLNNGAKMPVLGMGTWQLPEGTVSEQAVSWALEAGYRLIDTASIYRNEKSVGNAIRKSGIQRDEIFLATKIWNSEHANPEKAFEASLARLGLDYVDLYLIHWPVAERLVSWRVFEKLQKEGKCRAIGVSNFNISHLQELLGSCDVVPAVNQVEFSPYLYRKDLLEFCKKSGIALESYSPLVRGQKFSDSGLLALSSSYSKTPAQILLRWALQHGLITIPKASSQKHIMENADVFDFSLSESDMAKLDSLNENLHVCWNPENV